MSAAAAFERVERLAELGRLDDAERQAREALLVDPADARLLGALAGVLLRAGRHADGLAAAEAACAAEPDYERAHRLRGLLCSRLGRHAEATWACFTALGMMPEWAPSAVAYATVLQAAGELPKALEVAHTAVRLDPELADAHLVVADISDELGDRASARAAYAEVLRLQPDHAVARHDLALQEIRSRRMGRALSGLIDAGQLDPTMPQLLPNVGVVLWRLAWWLRIWLAVAAIVLIGEFGDDRGMPVRLAAAVVLAVTAALAWWTGRDLPPQAARVARAALRDDRPLAFTCLALLACLALYLAILVLGHTGPAVVVFLILGVLGLLALAVGLGRRVRR